MKRLQNSKKRTVSSEGKEDQYYGAKKPVKKVMKEKRKIQDVTTANEEKLITELSKKQFKTEDNRDVWKWWEEDELGEKDDKRKWKTLEHNGPVFAPPYERVPVTVKFFYDGEAMELSEKTEEVASFYARILDHKLTNKDTFKNNFFKDWRNVMTPEEKEVIREINKCDFSQFNQYYEERKRKSKESKASIKKENEELTARHGFCIIDGHKQKIANFRIEAPGLFKGRGEHPKMGMLKKRIEAEDISINIGREAKVPEPPPGHKWKEVVHKTNVSWLACWTENVFGHSKYITLNQSSKFKGERDWHKYETARKLRACIKIIEKEYTSDFNAEEMEVRQRAVALYFIDKLALRAGCAKSEGTAATVECCSLRVQDVTLYEERDGQKYVVCFDFLGKDSIRYINSVAVEKEVFKNLKLFMDDKQPSHKLFDRLNTAALNKYLNNFMEGLTVKVFRTYNACITLQEQLDLLTQEDMSIPEKIASYKKANRTVALLCNHQRAVPKDFFKSMEKLKAKIAVKDDQIKKVKKEIKAAKRISELFDKKNKEKEILEKKLRKYQAQLVDEEDSKVVFLKTSKLNYIDPRIVVAWCKKWSIPIGKIYNKTQRERFRWAIEMAGPDFRF